jgi:O-acetyl-ADP-ribose deacetylase (regulator of RNase III)
LARKGCVRSALGIAREKSYRSIAFPLIGAGTGGFQPEQALEIVEDEDGKSEYFGEVRIVRFSRSAQTAHRTRGRAFKCQQMIVEVGGV